MTELHVDPATAEHRATFVGGMRMVPGAVAIIAAAHEGERSGLAATAWNSLSADPPMLLACVNRQASAHAIIHRAGAFSVNLLTPGHEETVAIFSAQRGLAGAARFLPGAWNEGPAGQPLLVDALASFECTLEGAHDYGSHTILVGRVGAMRTRDDCEAMIYLDGTFAQAARSL